MKCSAAELKRTGQSRDACRVSGLDHAGIDGCRADVGVRTAEYQRATAGFGEREGARAVGDISAEVSATVLLADGERAGSIGVGDNARSVESVDGLARAVQVE